MTLSDRKCQETFGITWFYVVLDQTLRRQNSFSLSVIMPLNLSHNGRLMQETPRKCTKPTNTKNDRRGDPRLDGKMMQRMTLERWELFVGETWHRIGMDGLEKLRKHFPFLDSGGRRRRRTRRRRRRRRRRRSSSSSSSSSSLAIHVHN